MSKVKIILIEDIKSLGRAGDIVSVSEGYARNFLFPQSKAALATEPAEAKHAQKQADRQQSEADSLAALQKQATALDGTELFITAKVKADSQDLYAAVKDKDVASAIKDQANLTVKPGAISLPNPIESLGTFDALVSLSKEVEANIKITIQADE